MRWLLCLVTISTAAAAEPPVTALAFAPDGKSLLVGSQAGVVVRSWPDLKMERTIATRLANVHDVAFAPDGKTLALAGGAPAVSGSAEFVAWPSGELRFRINPHKDVIHSVAWSKDGNTLVTASADQTLAQLNASSGMALSRFEGHSRPVLAVVWLPGGRQLVSAGGDGTLRVWDGPTGKLARTLTNHTQAATGLAVQPAKEGSESVLVSIGDDRTVRLWQPTLGRMMRFAKLPSEPRAVVWTGQSIVVACQDGKVRWLDAESLEITATTPAVDGVAYALAAAPDGAVVVGGSDGQLKRLASQK